MVDSLNVIPMLHKLGTRICIIVIVVLLGMLAYWAAFPDNAPPWTGFGSYATQKNRQAEKKLWDWLQLLLVPSLLAVGGWWLNKSQKLSEQKIETDRQQQKALEDYYNCMTELMLKGELFEGKKSEQSRKVARIRTLTVLGNLDADRKGQVLQFLYESELLNVHPIVELNGADFTNARLEYATLSGVELRGVYFNNSCLKGANFQDAIISGSDFTGADLTGSVFTNAIVKQANFSNAKLYDAIELGSAERDGADFDKAHLTKDQVMATHLFKKGGRPI